MSRHHESIGISFYFILFLKPWLDPGLISLLEQLINYTSQTLLLVGYHSFGPLYTHPHSPVCRYQVARKKPYSPELVKLSN